MNQYIYSFNDFIKENKEKDLLIPNLFVHKNYPLVCYKGKILDLRTCEKYKPNKKENITLLSESASSDAVGNVTDAVGDFFKDWSVEDWTTAGLSTISTILKMSGVGIAPSFAIDASLIVYWVLQYNDADSWKRQMRSVWEIIFALWGSFGGLGRAGSFLRDVKNMRLGRTAIKSSLKKGSREAGEEISQKNLEKMSKKGWIESIASVSKDRILNLLRSIYNGLKKVPVIGNILQETFENILTPLLRWLNVFRIIGNTQARKIIQKAPVGSGIGFLRSNMPTNILVLDDELLGGEASDMAQWLIDFFPGTSEETEERVQREIIFIRYYMDAIHDKIKSSGYILEDVESDEPPSLIGIRTTLKDIKEMLSNLKKPHKWENIRELSNNTDYYKIIGGNTYFRVDMDYMAYDRDNNEFYMYINPSKEDFDWNWYKSEELNKIFKNEVIEFEKINKKRLKEDYPVLNKLKPIVQEMVRELDLAKGKTSGFKDIVNYFYKQPLEIKNVDKRKELFRKGFSSMKELMIKQEKGQKLEKKYTNKKEEEE